MLLERKWRFRSFYGFNVKVGTTIIGVLSIIVNLFILVIIRMESNDEDNANKSQMMGIFGTIAAIHIIIGSLLIYGNLKAKSIFMIPTVYWFLANLILSIILIIVYASSDDAGDTVLPQLLGVFIGMVLGLLLIQVVRSRIADVQESELRKKGFA